MVVIKLLEFKAHMWHKIYNVFIKITDVLYEKSMRAYNKALERIERGAEDGRTKQVGNSDKFNY